MVVPPHDEPEGHGGVVYPSVSRAHTPRTVHDGAESRESFLGEGGVPGPSTQITPRDASGRPLPTSTRTTPRTRVRDPDEATLPGVEMEDGHSVSRFTEAGEPHAFADPEEKRDAIAAEAEERREQAFREAEEERERLFREAHPELAGKEGDVISIRTEAPSDHAIEEAARRIADQRVAEILATVKEEREANEREMQAAAEQRRRLDELNMAERARISAEHEQKIAALDEELRLARADLEAERQERLAAEAARIERDAALSEQRHADILNQLGEIRNVVHETKEECARKEELINQQQEDKAARRSEKDPKQQQIFDMLTQMIQDREQEKARAEAERIAAAERPG